MIAVAMWFYSVFIEGIRKVAKPLPGAPVT